MELLLANHSSYPRIGDDPDQQLLRRTITQRDKGEKDDADVHAAEDRLTEQALAEQSAARLDVVTDGLVRWYDPISHLAGQLAGVRINGLLRFFDTNTYFRQPIVQARPQRTTPLLVDELKFAQARSSQPVKMVLTGPYTLARHSMEASDGAGGFTEVLEAYTEALAEEVGALAAAGAGWIQVDEPSLLKQPGDISLVERSLHALAARKGSAQLALSVYFGDPAPIYDRLQALPVDLLVLDFTYSPHLVETVATRGAGKTLGLGLIDGRNTRLEDPARVVRQLEKIAMGTKSGRAWLTPSCGLEYLPRDRARKKLHHLAAIKKTFLGSAA
jgi:5-methyltetrahydropteroyltriglutamate--homocysteine methyltransferase